jgi:hypothetical protein
LRGGTNLAAPYIVVLCMSRIVKSAGAMGCSHRPNLSGRDSSSATQLPDRGNALISLGSLDRTPIQLLGYGVVIFAELI